MLVSYSPSSRLKLSPVAGAVIAVAGMAALFATSWDDAWHTDLGRDSAWIPPHLLLYGSVAVVGLIVVGWGLRVLVRVRSVRLLLRQRALLVAGAGGLATLAAAPVDGWWHATFGRDAVLWSPPHMLVIFASAALVSGVLAGLGPSGRPASGWRWAGAGVRTALGGLLLGDLVASVIEYDTDVPKFSPVYYLPVLLAAALTATVLARRLVDGRAPVTAVVAVYVLLRLATTGVLALLDRSTPVLPIAALGLVLADLPWRGRLTRYAAAAAGVSILAWVASAARAATEPAGAIAVVAVPVLAVAAIAVLIGLRWGRPVAAALAVALVAGLPLLVTARPAAAHDAGEGPPVRPVLLTGTSTGHRTLRLTGQTAGTDCGTLAPQRLVARRAGRTVTAPLARAAGCRFTGTLRVPTGDRWFTYLDLRDSGGDLEAWLPLPAGRPATLVEHRDLYRPARAGRARPVETATGTVLYAAGLALLALAVWLAVGAGTRPAQSS
jgi:hypothetical protein